MNARRNRSAAGCGLAEPMDCGKFWRNRLRQDAVRVQLKEWEGYPLLDLRLWFTDSEGKMKPSGKGLSIGVRHLPKLHAAVTKALEEARARGLLSGDGKAGPE